MFCTGLRLVLSTGSWKRRQVSHCTRRRSCSAGQFPLLQLLSGHTSFINNPGKWQCPETEQLCQSKEPLTNLPDICFLESKNYAFFLRSLKGFKSRILLALLSCQAAQDWHPFAFYLYFPVLSAVLSVSLKGIPRSRWVILTAGNLNNPITQSLLGLSIQQCWWKCPWMSILTISLPAQSTSKLAVEETFKIKRELKPPRSPRNSVHSIKYCSTGKP